MNRAAARVLAWPIEWRLALVSGLVAIVWAILVLEPLGPTTIDPDASATVLYFQRIVAGQHLEAFVPTTPKPLLTMLYGLTWTVGHDWRWLTWETIVLFGAAVAAAAALVARLVGRVVESARIVEPARVVETGPVAESGRFAAEAEAPGPVRVGAWPAVAGAAFVVAGLLGSSDLLLEVSRANSLVWALAFWLLAGLAITARPARPRLAGCALFLAGLCRFETFALDAVAVVALVASAWWRGRRLDRGRHLGPDRRPDRHRDSRSPRVGEIVGVLLALAALPVAMLHDWLLTGDPLWFLSVPADYTAIYDAGLRPIDPVRFAGTFAAHEAGLLPLVVVAIVGLAALTRARERLMAAGIGALAVGVMGLLFLLAARATYISNRYYEPIDLAVLPAAAIGAGVIAAIAGVALPRLGTDAQRRRAGTRSTTLGVVLAAFAVVVALALTWAPLPLDRRATAELDNVRQASVNLARVIPDARAPLLDGAVRQGDVPAQAGAPAADLRTVALLAPSRDVSRIAVELNTRMTLVGDLYAFLLRWGIGGLRSGQYVLHDAAADRPVALFAPFELDGSEETTNVGAVTLTRRFSLGAPGQGSGIWLDQVR